MTKEHEEELLRVIAACAKALRRCEIEEKRSIPEVDEAYRVLGWVER